MTSPRKIREFADQLERAGKFREAIAWRFLARSRQRGRVLMVLLAIAVSFAVAALCNMKSQ